MRRPKLVTENFTKQAQKVKVTLGLHYILKITKSQFSSQNIRSSKLT